MAERKERVFTIATTPLCRDGLTEVLLTVARVAAENREVHFALGEDATPEILSELKKIGNVHDLPSRKKKTFSYFLALCRLLRGESCGIVHIHGNSATMALDLLAAKMAGVPVRVTHCHNQAEQPRLKRMTLGRLLNRWVTHPAACSEASGKALYTRDFTVIRNGIDTERFRFSEKVRQILRSELGMEERFVIGHVGRFTEQKNHRRLLRIFREILRIRPEAILLFCGTGELEAEIRELTEQLGLRDRVRFSGVVNTSEAYYAAMDVFVLPSLFEGLPLVGVEAQASGLPCVFSDTITRECGILPDVRFLSLEAEDSAWAREICSARAADRTSAADLIREAGYDRGETLEQVRRFYAGL